MHGAKYQLSIADAKIVMFVLSIIVSRVTKLACAQSVRIPNSKRERQFILDLLVEPTAPMTSESYQNIDLY